MNTQICSKLVTYKLILRWVKFEEDVEEGANRWSKPHVSSLSLHSLMELRSVNSMGSWRRWPTGGAINCLLPLPSLPHGAQVSQHHGVLDEGANRWS
jgi:hypothetical protein